ncbi:MAG: acylneuraminate cytidylyltransferase family protein [Polaromonas sp.]|uniref:acylneuraminate cytidylyltransferase family protein n=1 Tax=Polaromonas sp. TaxID=1869339 RepID=UPI00273775E3|nr:acylneuraminate cytidylyltransferase family protein [Polaromonas sp.]MDP2820545.1 acylneuraminate cytidylyltransferase family protein [Polaromonas sp.]
MIENLKILGLVTARGGSKGLPGKNVRLLSGKPLIAWTIDAAKAAGCLDAIVVSTDDPAIADAARQAGAEVPFMRPEELSGDTASSIDVVLHAMDVLAASGRHFDIVVLLEPTSPLREPSDIDQGLARLVESGAGSIVSVCRVESMHPAFIFRREDSDRLRPYLERQPTGLRRQDIEPLYFLEGTLYASYIDVLRAQRSFYHADTIGYEVPKWKSLEIDDIDDFKMLEALIEMKGLSK